MKRKRNESNIDPQVLVQGILQGDRSVLAQSITLVESGAERHFEAAQKLLEQVMDKRINSIRIGITGVPGAGKSTFIDAFGTYLCSLGHKVAVLAVDPTSHVSRGSILGDKTRMERLSVNPDAFIRPSPSSGTLGGVSRKTRETMFLCEAAGYDIILIETMGVGQGEYLVRGMVDFFLLLVLTGAGDELQTMKKGIMELPDLVVVNKADGDNLPLANKAVKEYSTMLHFLKPYTEGWTTEALPASALEEKGIREIWSRIQAFQSATCQSGLFAERRRLQQKEWFHESIKNELLYAFYRNPSVKERLFSAEQAIVEEKAAVSSTVKDLVGNFFKSLPK
ncbi:methylmalonyl Co-A mutase-associated GTPase MeaB [Bacillus sp. FJAT-42376]|uniref:methylmalonyl Co-A mutase-associated GTPase MeaB n=1 Tax=Bacillus sp. FJAT-42376 TaxID=2014076 RepID=UPI000F4F295F|nr:methylmalonyl Co-A mutase-associated GTPase MeaB [Bacillus sp. FJAT-42376]AZB43480.1 methylmalonyl Co-A mutase-associated GTPase MeaB [Bacillus sp. FJAT-42376]